MEGKYTLGAFTFDTKEEYEQARRELNRISELKKRFDLDNPTDAKRILDAVSTRPDLFKTAVGMAFVRKLKRVVKNNISINSSKEASRVDKNETVRKSNHEDISVNSKVGKKNVNRYINRPNLENRVVLPIIVEAKNGTNALFVFGFFLSYIWMLFSARYAPETMSDVASGVIFTAIIIGISNLCGIRKRKKKADKYIYEHLTSEQKKALEKENAKNKEDAEGARFLFKVALFIIAIAIPPLLVVIIIALLVMGAWPKIKWIFNNIKSGVALIIYFSAFALTGGIQVMYEDRFDKQMPLIPAVIITAVLALGTYTLIKRWHNRQFYLAVCNMASFPFMVFLALLPFVAVAGMMYIRANMHELTGSGSGVIPGGNPNGGGNPYGGTGPDFIYDVPPQYMVSGYSYYNSYGTLVVVGPYKRTMPDASIYNNLSYRN